ncbi:MAG TPA: ASCH domain-containing protein [Steroidobacteraceae bacterium]|nr:ASCH domain-containing protein [Steroidobacteraceae bacterium]
MTPEEVWSVYQASIGADAQSSSLSYRTRRFSDQPAETDALCALVLSGTKRATAPCLWQFVDEPVPVPGDLHVVIDSRGLACCVIRTTRVQIVPFRNVPLDFVRLEGEGDGGIEHWRRVHWSYYQRVLAPLGREPTDDMPVVCQEFEVVHRVGD